MGIEPKRAALQSLYNTAFRDLEKPACDWRANFRVMRDNVGLPETTPPFAIEFPLSNPLRRSRTAAVRRQKWADRLKLYCDAFHR